MHLTDDPGWRFEVKQFPQLMKEQFFWTARQPGKFYAQDELNELVAFCAKLNVRVLPEIDTPDHSEWMFCCIPVNWDGLHYTEVDGLKYSTTPR